MVTLIVSFSLFAFVASATPGPSNVLAFSNGSQFGGRATLPFVTGCSLGASSVLLLTASGLAGLFNSYPFLSTLLAWCGASWLTWLSWKLFRAPAIQGSTTGFSTPLPWHHGALMQAVNPKVWMMAITACALFIPATGASFVHNAMLAVIFFIVTIPCMAAWGWMGQGSGALLKTERQRRVLNQVLAVMLVVSVWGALV
ncbi:MAG: lysine transporter LysE [Oceanospirillaceae bacterium]|nr:lysine transporter LysE [Oceanospirillaceae bacterium]